MDGPARPKDLIVLTLQVTLVLIPSVLFAVWRSQSPGLTFLTGIAQAEVGFRTDLPFCSRLGPVVALDLPRPIAATTSTSTNLDNSLSYPVLLTASIPAISSSKIGGVQSRPGFKNMPHSSQHSNRRLAILVALVTVAATLVMYQTLVEQPTNDNVMTHHVPTRFPDILPFGSWKEYPTYSNSDLGITFWYPARWGEPKTTLLSRSPDREFLQGDRATVEFPDYPSLLIRAATRDYSYPSGEDAYTGSFEIGDKYCAQVFIDPATRDCKIIKTNHADTRTAVLFEDRYPYGPRFVRTALINLPEGASFDGLSFSVWFPELETYLDANFDYIAWTYENDVWNELVRAFQKGSIRQDILLDLEAFDALVRSVRITTF